MLFSTLVVETGLNPAYFSAPVIDYNKDLQQGCEFEKPLKIAAASDIIFGHASTTRVGRSILCLFY